jgi:catechol 2,3-dioxygenase-like lactoylglutathione lyase family enzyme
MKRFHVHMAVDNLQESIRFYSSMFGAQPTIEKDDYAKWMLEDPRVNFAISRRGHPAGVNHLGVQVDSSEELRQMRAQLEVADASLIEQTGASCCYARSDKYWVTDPAGIAWETFQSLDTIPVYGKDIQVKTEGSACCVPVEANRVSAQPATGGVATQERKSEQPQPACCA